MSRKTRETREAAHHQDGTTRRDVLRRTLMFLGASALIQPNGGIVAQSFNIGTGASKLKDADIRKCIVDTLAKSKLKDDGITATVTGGEATLSGAIKVPGHKGTAAQFAQRCRATKVTNRITIKQDKAAMIPGVGKIAR